jgi:hypothetical protein
VVQVVQVDHIDAEPSQARLTRLPYVGRIGPHVEATGDFFPPHQPELGGQQHLITSAPDGPTDQFLVLVGVGRVHHPDARVQRGVDDAHWIAITAVSYCVT